MFRTVLDPARPNLFVDGASALLGLTERSAFSVLGPRRPPSPVRGTLPASKTDPAVVELACIRSE